MPDFVTTLRGLLEKATPGPWVAKRATVYSHLKSVNGNYVAEHILKFRWRQHDDAALLAYLRNHAEAILRVVEAASTHVWTPQLVSPSEAQATFMKLREALAALDAGKEA